MAWFTDATAALTRHLPGMKRQAEARSEKTNGGTVVNPGSHRVLVIDDDAVTLLVISAALRDAGYDVVEARDGAEGLSLFHSQRAAAVVTDLVMPNHGGLETVKELRRLDPTVRIVVVSGVTGGSAEYLRTAVRFGADRVLPKPVDLRELTAMLAGLLAQSQ
jgi:DNA-binding response OmpR family regulator